MSSSTSEPAAGLRPTILRTTGAALVGAGVWVVFGGPLDVSVGLVAVAVFVGWLVGSAARSGKLGGSRRPVRAVAVGGALLAWLIGLVGVYLYALAALPGESSLGERIGSTSIVSFYAQQAGPLEVVEVAVLIGTAWRASR